MEFSSSPKKIKVLIVEDNRFSSELVYEIIGRGYTRYIARTGEEGVNLYTLHSPDIVFLDIDLPDISGLKVLEKIKKMNKEAYVVMISGHGTKNNIEKAIENDVKGFLGKPFSRGKIIEHIKTIEEQIAEQRSMY